MRRKAGWVVVGLTGVVSLSACATLLFAGIILELSMVGCLPWTCAPDRAFDAADLSLPVELFSQGTDQLPMRWIDDDDPSVNLYRQSFDWGVGRGMAFFDVGEHTTVAGAESEFDRSKTWFFRDPYSLIPWGIDAVLPYNSLVADDYYIACGTRLVNDYRCRMVSRYEELVLAFEAMITDDMTKERFMRIAVYIDEKVSEHLSHETSSQ